ncbi:MAG: tRNA1(Val) (adenine(37)-N6)-methyltransferase [Rhodospirillales bacterium]
MEVTELSIDQISEDAVLGGQVKIRQPQNGYRAAIDPVLLAAAVPAKPGQRIVDAGAGVGTAGLCLAARVKGLSITAVELNPALAQLAAENGTLNAVEMTVVQGDISKPLPDVLPGAFDHVMTNPPYLPEHHGHPSLSPLKRAATHECDTGIDDWIGFAHSALKNKGTLTLIYRADRLDTVMPALTPRFGDIGIFPLWPKAAESDQGVQEAKRVIVSARKGVASPVRMLSGLVLHETDGGFTPQAERILRGEKGVVI